MNIENFVSAPKLIEIVIDDKELVEAYGEPITFYSYDIVKMGIYFDFFNARTAGDYEKLTNLIKQLILNDQGEQVLTEGTDLPMDILAAAIMRIGENLGKSQSKTSTSKAGQPQKSSQSVD